jgi:2-polyprenyl-6-hydroxyphenyl methylase / 3-demethylubiquinone-9 3-methyltransferase
MSGKTVSPEEVARFDALAARWWDPEGPMRPLHRMNPTRVAWINQRLGPVRSKTWTTDLTSPLGEGVGEAGCPPAIGHSAPSCSDLPQAAGIDPPHVYPVRVLDVGCGAGLAAEALARLGFDVLGLDAAGEAIAAAHAHAAGQNLPLAYRTGVAEDLLAENARFPVITALEVIEHVPDPAAFVATLAALLAPGGRLFLSTLNRTPQSFIAAKVGAEYLLRWLPVGTHDWRKFITPAELGGMLRRTGLRVAAISGLVGDPLTGRWKTSRNLAINYILAAEK